jgi:hypothetical protein
MKRFRVTLAGIVLLIFYAKEGSLSSAAGNRSLISLPQLQVEQAGCRLNCRRVDANNKHKPLI